MHPGTPLQFSWKKEPKWKQKTASASDLTATNCICLRLCLGCNSRWYFSFLKENIHALGNCMQKYCIRKGKPSLVRDRELPFKSAFSSLKNLPLFCTRKPQNCLLTTRDTTLFTTRSSGLQLNHLSTSLGSAPGQPQIHIKCPDAVKHQQQQMDDWGLPHCSGKTKSSQFQLRLVPLPRPPEVPAQGLPLQLAQGDTTDQPCPRLWPKTSPTAALARSWGSPAAHFGDPSPRCSVLCFLSGLLLGRGFWQAPNSALCLHRLFFSPQKCSWPCAALKWNPLLKESWTSPHAAGCSLLLGCMRQLENPRFSRLWPAPLGYT